MTVKIRVENVLWFIYAVIGFKLAHNLDNLGTLSAYTLLLFFSYLALNWVAIFIIIKFPKSKFSKFFKYILLTFKV